MRVRLLIDWTGLHRPDGLSRLHRAGEEISVYHVAGAKLLHRRQARWIRQEEGDPAWEPAEMFRYKQATPQHNRMVREAQNK